MSEWPAHFGSLSPRRPDLGPGAAAAAAAAADDNDIGSDDDDNDNNSSEPTSACRSRPSARRLPGRLID